MGPQGRSGRVWKTLSPPGFDSQTAQSIDILCTVYATPVHRKIKHMVKIRPLLLSLLPVKLAGYSTTFLSAKQRTILYGTAETCFLPMKYKALVSEN